MKDTKKNKSRPLTLLTAGAKGAVASTVAAASAALNQKPDLILPYLTTRDKLPSIGLEGAIKTAGWDSEDLNLVEAAKRHGVLSSRILRSFESQLQQTIIKPAPDPSCSLKRQVENIIEDLKEFASESPESFFVLVNLLPAAFHPPLDHIESIDQLYEEVDAEKFPDLAYVIGAVLSGIPVVNFTPNTVELDVICREAEKIGVPIAGRDGKTGQTYLKVSMASALKARSLRVDGWYSLNILGNEDGRNLMDPEKASGKLSNKTNLLDEILGYDVGQNYGVSTHKVIIDYYPPRGDAKEAWDVIDFKGIFGLPMSIRINFQCRDSILAAPMVIDLSRWTGALALAGKKGPVPELGFYFKKPVGLNPPVTFQDQIRELDKLEKLSAQAH
jgi:myo-inositol-1-phosphate synthase